MGLRAGGGFNRLKVKSQSAKLWNRLWRCGFWLMNRDASVLAILLRRETVIDWEVKIADFVVLLAKDAKKVPDAANRAKSLWEIRLRC